MKTFVSFFVAAFLLLSTSSYSQEQTSVFQNASLIKNTGSTPYVQLTWKKGAENTNYYLVERSLDGKDFKQIALVFTAEDPQFTDYNYRDRSFTAAENAAYYRITIVNERNELTYLSVKKVELASGSNSMLPPASSETVIGKK